MKNIFSRTEMLFGKSGMDKLFNAKVAIFGIGGVGGYVVEALSRSGIGRLDLYDPDTVTETNINRQIHASHKTLNQFKVDVAKERILEINPGATVQVFKIFYTAENAAQVDLSGYDYVVDAIDTVSGKIELAVRTFEQNVPLISSMGTGNKINPSALEVADLYDTSVCPLAKVMRHELRKRGVLKLKVVYSKEPAIPLSIDRTFCQEEKGEGSSRKQVPGSNAFVPGAAGLILAGEVVKDIIGL